MAGEDSTLIDAGSESGHGQTRCGRFLMNDPSPLEAIFFAALEKSSPQERAAYLDEACRRTIPSFAGQIQKMLAAQDQAGSFLEKPAKSAVITVDYPITERVGSVIGPYKLLEQIGKGGFGVVFVAEQTQPVRRKVALKILKPGMDTRPIVARFEAKRQALAIIDNPNIAKVHDGAAPIGPAVLRHGTGQGRAHHRVLRSEPVDTAATPGAFRRDVPGRPARPSKGIIHRDLKPSNVLVSRHDTTPVVKVIDFGVAKADPDKSSPTRRSTPASPR